MDLHWWPNNFGTHAHRTLPSDLTVGFDSALTNKLMVRVTNYFETQVRVPTSTDGNTGRRHHESRSTTSRSAFQAHMHGRETGNTKMTDEQMVSWYGKILDSVRLRYRKLQRFAR